MPAFPQYQNATLVEFANFTAQSANYTAKSGDVVLVTTGASAITVTLPPVAQGGPVTVRKVDTGTGAVTIKTSDGSTIDTVAGATGIATAASQNAGFTVASDGTNWWVVGT